MNDVSIQEWDIDELDELLGLQTSNAQSIEPPKQSIATQSVPVQSIGIAGQSIEQSDQPEQSTEQSGQPDQNTEQSTEPSAPRVDVDIVFGGNVCRLSNCNGRTLDDLADESIDCIITDAPHLLTKSSKGGNRNFAAYDCFEYTVQDFEEKFRVLKPGCFLVEFIPEENADNFEYLYRLKKNALAAGFKYYSKVTWKKGTFVANIGKKAKNTEDVLLFTKKAARGLRPDAKRNKAEPGVEHYMSGTSKMLPTNFDVQPVKKDEIIAQSQKPVELMEEIIGYVTLANECILDQFCGSGVVGLAALRTGRNAICIEKDKDTFNAAVQSVRNGVTVR